MTLQSHRLDLPAMITPSLIARLAERVVARSDADVVTTTAPYTGAPLATLPTSTPSDIRAAFERARVVQAQWAATPVAERAQIVLRFHDLVLERQDEVLDLMQAESGKTRRDALLEVIDIALAARYYARHAEHFLAPQRRKGTIPLLTRTTEWRHPKGVVTIISPWNYPLSMAAGDTIPALLAGNAVVQKPDTQTALTALWAVELMRESGLPADLWQIVVGTSSSMGAALLDDTDYLMFTGSTEAGRHLASEAGKRLIGASLELGGKNPMIVLPDADVAKAAHGAVEACFSSAGQLCISIERIYVADDIHDAFNARFTEATRKLSLGASYDYVPAMGSLTTDSQLQTVQEHLTDAVAKGAKVLAGGRARPDLGPLFHEPTILTDVTPDMTLFGDETFGPVVSIYRYSSIDEAIASANASPYGLNASVWGRDGRRARSVAAQIRCGTVNVNDAFVAAWGSIDAPMGGMGDSGLGRRHGAAGILKYTEAQTVAQQRLHRLTPPAKLSYARWAGLLTAVSRLLKRLWVR